MLLFVLLDHINLFYYEYESVYVNDMKKDNIKENLIRLKICGLKRYEDIKIVNKYKADYIGFVFAESKRQIIFEEVKSLKNNLKMIF